MLVTKSIIIYKLVLPWNRFEIKMFGEELCFVGLKDTVWPMEERHDPIYNITLFLPSPSQLEFSRLCLAYHRYPESKCCNREIECLVKFI